MKLVNKTKDKKGKTKKSNGIKPKKEHVLIVAQEIKFARLLSGNEKKARDRVVKTLKKWLLNCFEKKYEFRDDDFNRVWKGLFYAVWMSDKPLIQEELCDNIAAILDVFPPEQLRYALMMTKAGFKVLATEWYGIDHHRMDKFLMLVRRYLRGSLRCIQRCGWEIDACNKYAQMLMASDGILALQTPHYARNASSMLLHFTDCYLEELSKVSQGAVPEDSVCALLQPFVALVAGGGSAAGEGLARAARRLFTALLRQSELGLRYQHATRAWQRMGCPEGGPEALELVSGEEAGEEEEEEEEADDEGAPPAALDPRAGRVDVVLQPLPLPAAALASALGAQLPRASSKAYRRTKLLIDRFEQLSQGQYPLREEAPPTPAYPRRARYGALALRALDRRLRSEPDDLLLRGLGRKHRKRLLSKARSGLSIIEDLQLAAQNPSQTANNNWHIEAAGDDAKPQDSDKENRQKPKKPKVSKQTDAQTSKAIRKRRLSAAAVPDGDAGTKKQRVDKKVDTKVITPVTKVTKKVLNCKTQKNAKVDNKPVTLDAEANTSVRKQTAIKDVNAVKMTNFAKGSEKSKKVTSIVKSPRLDKVKFQQLKAAESSDSPKKVKFVLKNNSMQKPLDYYKSVRQSPSIPFDSSRKPEKTNLKLSSPSPINPFFKKKLKLKK